MTTTNEDGLTDALVQSAFTTMAVLNRVGAENDLSLTQLRVLAILRDRRVRMSGLAKYLGLEKSSMTGLVDRAVTRGLLERAPSAEDRRSIEVFLSADGAKLVDRLYGEITGELSTLTSALTAAEQRRLQSLLSRLLMSGPS